MTDDLSDILERIASGEYSKADITALQQALQGEEGRSLFQLGKYNVTIGEGQNIQIGDRIYAEINDAAVQAIVEAIQNGAAPKSPAQIDFRPYLRSLVDTYREWWRYYTLTDATSKIQESKSESPSLLDFGLMVQTVFKDETPIAPETNRRQEPQEKIERMPVQEGIRKYADEHVLLVGRPGSGKSTALIRLLLEMATQALEHGSGKIPILVELRFWQTAVSDRIQSFLHKHDPTLSLDDSTLSSLLRQGHFLLLVDGLNELPSETARTQLASFRQDYSQVPMIFTTRDLGLGGDLGIEKRLEMQPLTEGQMKTFIRAYVPDLAETMLRQLSDRLREFGQTPLLLWMLCEVLQQSPEHQMPSNLAGIFQAFTRMYEDSSVRKHEVALLKGDVRPLSDRRLWKPALQAIAAVMMQGETPVDFRVAIHRDEAERELSRIFPYEKFPVRDILDDLLKYHLLQNRSTNQIEFRHQLIQEYYAAEYLLRLLPELSDEQLKGDYLNLLKWTEPIALMLTLVDEEDQALRVVKLALDEVDLLLGARLTKEVRLDYQTTAAAQINALDMPLALKVKCWAVSLSEVNFPDLLNALNDSCTSIRRSAREALGQALGEKVLGLIQELEKADSISSQLNRLEDSDVDVRENAAALLGLIGNQTAVSGLLTALEDSDADVRMSAAESLGQIGNKAAVSGLLTALEDSDANVRWFAANALGQIRCQATVLRLLIALQDPHASVREHAAKALGQIGNETAIPDLLTALEDPDAYIRWNAVKSLGHIGNEAAIPGLLTMLEDSHTEICESATGALGEIGGNAAVPGLLKALQHSDVDVRQSAVIPLGEIGSEAAVPGLLTALGDSNYWIRWHAAEALGKIGSEAAVPGLLTALGDSNNSVRVGAAEALGKIGSEAAVHGLLAALEDSGNYVREQAVKSLGKIGSETAVFGLLKALKDSDDHVRWFTATALGKIGSEAAVPGLLAALDEANFMIYLSAARSLEQIGSPVPLAALWHSYCQNPNDHLRKTISAIQNRCKFYNYEIFHSITP